MRILFSGLLKVDSSRAVRLSEPLDYESPSGIKVTVQNREGEEDALGVTLEVEAATPEEVQGSAEAELERLVNLLSWQKGLVVLASRITGYEARKEFGQQSALIFAENIQVTAHLSMLVTIGAESVRSLSNYLSEETSDDLLEMIILWRDASTQSSDTTRFFLLYRILEDELGSRKNVDEWILAKHPETERRQTKDRFATIFTYLRDNIHPKRENRRFPFSDISKHVGELQSLVGELIVEKHPSARLG